MLDRQKHIARQTAAPGLVDTLRRIAIDNVAAPLRLAGPVSRVLPKLSIAAVKMLSSAIVAPKGGAPRTRFNRRISARRTFESVVFDFAIIKRIREALLAVLAGPADKIQAAAPRAIEAVTPQ